MKKRITLLMLLAVLCMALCIACGKEETSSSRHDDDTEESGGYELELSNDEKTSGDEEDTDEDTELYETDNTDVGQDEVIPNLQMIIYSNTKADFVIENAYIEEGSNGDCIVIFKTSSKVYKVLLADNGGLTCELAEGSDPSADLGGQFSFVGSCSYSYNDDTLTISVDMSDYGLNFDLHNVTDLVLGNGPEGHGWGPEFYTAAEVVRDECSSHDAVADADQTDGDGNNAAAADNGNISITDIDYTGDYTLVGGTGETYIRIWQPSGSDNYYYGFESRQYKAEEYWRDELLASYFPDGSIGPYFTWASSVYGNIIMENASFDSSGGFLASESGLDITMTLNTDGSFQLTISNGSATKSGTFVRK